jgi:formate hydrogenlyase transcriptional activator
MPQPFATSPIMPSIPQRPPEATAAPNIAGCQAGAPEQTNAAEAGLLDAAQALASRSGVQHTCTAVLDVVERLFAARSSWILLHDRATDELVAFEFRGSGAESYAAARVPSRKGIVGKVFCERETLFVPNVLDEWRWFDPDRVRRSGLTSVFTVPLEIEGDAVGVVGLDSPRFTADAPPSDRDVRRLRALGAIAAAAIRNARVLEEVEADRSRLQRVIEQRQHLRVEVGHLREQIRDAHAPDHAIGDSPTFREVLTQVDLVAPADSTVLLVGETGTGKELIAHAIHDRSRRQGRPFVAVNCAALPESLVESELFGHEKGSFTGALARKEGKFELAHLGTLFLDEIGDLPAQAQAKLLRVLQERELHRVGGVRSVPVDVRLIAATNRDLAACMHDGQFRPDLFYRLSVFPIRLPSLRERREDIPALVEHFVRRFAARQHKPVPRLADEVLQRLTEYHWPGNIRELQNVIERAVILVRGAVIKSELIALQAPGDEEGVIVSELPARVPSAPSGATVVPFSEAERGAILRALEVCGWRISGHHGAAEMLGLKPTTLHAKMKKLGIHRPCANGEDRQHAHLA